MRKKDAEIEALKDAVTALGVAEDILTTGLVPLPVNPVKPGRSAVSKLTARIQNITNHMNAAIRAQNV